MQFFILRLLLITFFLLNAILLFGQETKSSDTFRLPSSNVQSTISKMLRPISYTEKICLCCRHRGDTSELPLLVLNNSIKSNHFGQFILNPNSLEKVSILNRQEAAKRFGKQAQYGAIMLKINKNTKLLILSALLDHFNIKQEDRNLPICLNEDFITEPSKILGDITAIKKIEITEGRYWFYINQVPTSRKFINIITK